MHILKKLRKLKKIKTIIIGMSIVGLLLNGCSDITQDIYYEVVDSTTKSMSQIIIQKEKENLSNKFPELFAENSNSDNKTITLNDNEFITINNNNQPYFTDEEKQNQTVFEIYSDLDSLGRCGIAYANICKELMPTEERESIGMIKPTGWHTIKYDIVDGKYLYNRCHLIAFCLAGENANEKNLITGTRYLNVEGMLPYETEVAKYIDKNPDNHVLYRVSPVFENDDLIAKYVQIEAWSIEDNGTGICFNVSIANIQPGIDINYHTGESCLK